MPEYLPIYPYLVMPQVVFVCRFCGEKLRQRQVAIGHESTAASCGCCRTCYRVTWKSPFPTIVMVRPDRQLQQVVPSQ